MSSLTIGQQIVEMRLLFPQFKYHCVKRQPTWLGFLQPTVDSSRYKIKIKYILPQPPKVWVVYPQIGKNAPHLYADESLCLYYPQDNSWKAGSSIARTIVPWTAEWLAFMKYGVL